MMRYILIIFALVLILAVNAESGRNKPTDIGSKWEDIGGGFIQPRTGNSVTSPNLQNTDNASLTLNRIDRHSSAFIAYATAAAYDMSATDMQGRIIRTTVQQAINVYNCEKGDNFWVLNRSGGTISLQPSETGTADRFWYNGTDTGADGDEIDVADGTTAECISTADNVLECFCFPTTGCTDGGAT